MNRPNLKQGQLKNKETLMNEKIILRLPQKLSANIKWLLLDADNQPLSEGEFSWDALSEQAENWQDKAVHVLLPGNQCIYIRHKTPAKNIRQIRTALPYSVEDQFAQDIDSLHFAIGSKDSEGYVTAEVLDKTYLQNILQQFDEAGIVPKSVTADYEALPQPVDASYLLIEDDNALIRFEGGASIAATHELLPIYLKQYIRSNTSSTENDENTPKKKLLIFASSKSAAVTDLIQHIQQTLANDWDIFIDKEEDASNESTNIITRNALELMGQNLQNSPVINFMQGEFKRKAAASKNWQIWKWPAVAASALLFLLVSSWGIEYWQLAKHLEALKAAQKKVYLDTFKSERRAPRPVSQMRGKINSLGGSKSAGQFLPVMAKLAQASNAIKNTQISDITFRANRGEMKVDFFAPDFATIEKFQQKLKALGLNIIPGATNQNGDQYKGRVTIKEQS